MGQPTRVQFATLMAGLKSNYPNWDFNLNDSAMMMFWYEQLNDIPWEVLSLGVRKLIAQEEFYPNVAKIRKACTSVSAVPVTEHTEAWGMVKRAIHNYGYMRAEEAIASLPMDVARAVRHMGGWTSLCTSENEEADRAHFYKVMQIINERRRSEDVLGIGLKQELEHYKRIALEQETRLRDAIKQQELEHHNRLIGCVDAGESSGNGSLESVRAILSHLVQEKAAV